MAISERPPSIPPGILDIKARILLADACNVSVKRQVAVFVDIPPTENREVEVSVFSLILVSAVGYFTDNVVDRYYCVVGKAIGGGKVEIEYQGHIGVVDAQFLNAGTFKIGVSLGNGGGGFV